MVKEACPAHLADPYLLEGPVEISELDIEQSFKVIGKLLYFDNAIVTNTACLECI